MPYQTLADLPPEVRERYNPEQQDAFLQAFNAAYTPSDESSAFAIANEAAQGIKGLAGFKRLANNRFLAWYTNPYKDRDHEWFAEKAIDEDIATMQATASYPELWFCHTQGLKFGQCDAVFKAGRFAVATGTIDPAPLAQQLADYAVAHDFKLSHGFYFDPHDFIDNTYHQFHTFEISVLPPTSAANPFTFFASPENLGGVKMQATPSPEMQRHIEAALKGSGYTYDQFIGEAQKMSSALDKVTSYKASPLEEALLETESPTEQPEMEVEVEEPSMALPTDPAQMRAFLKTMGDMMKMVSDMKAMMDKAFAGGAEKKAAPMKEEMTMTEEQKALKQLSEQVAQQAAEIKALKEGRESQAKSVQGSGLFDALSDFQSQGQKKVVNDGAFDVNAFTNWIAQQQGGNN